MIRDNYTALYDAERLRKCAYWRCSTNDNSQFIPKSNVNMEKVRCVRETVHMIKAVKLFPEQAYHWGIGDYLRKQAKCNNRNHANSKQNKNCCVWNKPFPLHQTLCDMSNTFTILKVLYASCVASSLSTADLTNTNNKKDSKVFECYSKLLLKSRKHHYK